MKLLSKRQLQLSKYVSKDESRHTLQSVHFDGNTATVTDGHKLIQSTVIEPLSADDFPVSQGGLPLEMPENGFMVRGKDCQKALGMMPKKGLPVITDYISIEKKVDQHGYSIALDLPVQTLNIDKVDGKFPNINAVVGENDNREKMTVALDARYLKEICEYIIQGADKGRMARLELSIVKDVTLDNGQTVRGANYPIEITAEQDNHKIKAIIMPVKL